ncbi:MAG: tRNA glutamyl-Q(34) synthetase GluQRS [Alphaproteobacteria bacterium]|nr:tRNA glutamyl-Q(34) synthetase GluQRS [Alphaproteobacteria bacterium]
MQPVFRFAPSPNGRLHLGHAYSALLNADLAGKLGGRFLLRLEDIDTVRCTPELTQACLDDLAWLGLAWEKPVRIQSQHWSDYAAARERLKVQNLLYPCFCTRAEIAAASGAKDPDGAPIYPGTCARLTPTAIAMRIVDGEPHSWRLAMEKALDGAPALSYRRFHPSSRQEENVTADPARWGDAVLIRKDTPASYHLSVVVDDALQGITHVVRGADLEAATDLHVLLQHLLGLPAPRYHHHALITESGEKLSKSKGSETLADLRSRGVDPGEIRAMLGFPA